MPAIIETENYFEYYPAVDSYIEEIYFTNARSVKKGDLLLKIKSSEIEYKIEQVLKEINQINLEMDKQAGFKENSNKRFILEESLQKKQNELEGLQKVKDKFEIRASFDGKIYFKDSFKKDQWISKKEPVFSLYDNLNYRIIGFCNENDFKLLKENSEAKFIFNSGDMKDIKTNIRAISKVSIPYLDFPELSSDFNGDIATRQDVNKQLKTEEAYYKVLANIESKDLNLTTRKHGVIVANGENSSLISKFYKKTISVIIRESGF